MLFQFDIRPQVKERARSGKNSHYTPKKTADFEREVAYLAKMQMKGVKKFIGALYAEVTFCIERPKKSKYDYPKRGDSDNFQKSIFDALNNIVYDDDSQIVKVTALKKFSDENCIYLKIMNYDCLNESIIEYDYD